MRGWLIVLAVFWILALYTIALELAARWASGVWAGSRPRVVCGWCGSVAQRGRGPLTTGMCAGCHSRQMVDAQIDRLFAEVASDRPVS